MIRLFSNHIYLELADLEDVIQLGHGVRTEKFFSDRINNEEIFDEIYGIDISIEIDVFNIHL